MFNEKLKIVVSDSGSGIPGNSTIIFVSNKKDGVGLGLNIVKSLVERSRKIYHAANSRGVVILHRTSCHELDDDYTH